MKIAILLISFLVLSFAPDLGEIRILYKQAYGSKQKTITLNKKLESISKKDSKVLVAYKGSAIAMIAKYEKGAKEKTEVFKNGVSWVELAIKEEPENIEIRFVRLTLQQNSPKILKYNKHLKEDKDFVLSNFNQIQSPELMRYIKDYILHSNNFTEEEKYVISQP